MNHIKTSILKTCPFCKSQDIKVIDAYGVINASSLFKHDERIEDDKLTNVWTRPISTGMKEQYRCNSCGHCFEIKDIEDDIEVIKQ